MSRLGTTTRENRNIRSIENAKAWAERFGLANPVILDIGPGGMVSFFSRQISNGKHGAAQFGLKLAESATRKTGLFDLVSFEPGEIHAVFKDLAPSKFCIVDKEARVILAVREFAEKKGLAEVFELKTASVMEIMPFKADIVFAYNVIQRTENWHLALANISDAVKPGGLLSLECGKGISDAAMDSALFSFKKLDKNTYFRQPQ